MERTRRQLLGAISVLVGVLMFPLRLIAAQWNGKAFNEVVYAESLKSVGAVGLVESDLIELKAPEIAENGSIVPIQVSSEIPGTETIFVFAEKNPQPLVASFTFRNGAEPFFATRIKMGESASVHVVVLAHGKYFVASRFVKVTIGGCGESA
jgi:sulfur-oxidizing protein SoxY